MHDGAGQEARSPTQSKQFNFDFVFVERMSRRRSRHIRPCEGETLEAGTAMKFSTLGFDRLLRISCVFAILGLAVEAYTLLWFHPLSFVALALVGGLLIVAGMAVYLLSLLSFLKSSK